MKIFHMKSLIVGKIGCKIFLLLLRSKSLAGVDTLSNVNFLKFTDSVTHLSLRMVQ